jgi:alpha-glucosidase
VAANHRSANVRAQDRDPRSLLNLYRQLIALRRREPALVAGRQRLIERRAPTVAYLRELGGQRFLMLLNMAGDTYSFDFSEYGPRCRVVLSTYLDGRAGMAETAVRLRGNEGLILSLDAL